MPYDRSDFEEGELDSILNSKMVQKYLAYRDLASGIDALKADDEVMYDQLVKGIEGRVRVKESTVRSVLEAFVEEIETNTTALEEVDDDDGFR